MIAKTITAACSIVTAVTVVRIANILEVILTRLPRKH